MIHTFTKNGDDVILWSILQVISIGILNIVNEYLF